VNLISLSFTYNFLFTLGATCIIFVIFRVNRLLTLFDFDTFK
jgi:hypothetical protein